MIWYVTFETEHLFCLSEGVKSSRPGGQEPWKTVEVLDTTSSVDAELVNNELMNVISEDCTTLTMKTLSSGMWHREFADVLKNCGAFVFKGYQSINSLITLEDEGGIVLRNVGKHPASRRNVAECLKSRRCCCDSLKVAASHAEGWILRFHERREICFRLKGCDDDHGLWSVGSVNEFNILQALFYALLVFLKKWA